MKKTAKIKCRLNPYKSVDTKMIHMQPIVSAVLYLFLFRVLCSCSVGWVHYPPTVIKSLFYRTKPWSRFHAAASTSHDDHTHHPLSTTSRLSHIMLKVPSVDQAVDYWTQKGASVIRARKTEEGTYKSAFIALGNGQTFADDCFALELVSNNNMQLGNVIRYIGVSLLLQFQGNLKGILVGDKPKSEGDEPNGIPVKSCAAAPGDYFCRLALASRDLDASRKFYENILGMKTVAADERMVCLRYDTAEYGSPLTLVLESVDEPLQLGTCFDHITVRTNISIQEYYQRIRTSACTVYMAPTEMFGSTVMGVKDPNGYSVVFVGRP